MQSRPPLKTLGTNIHLAAKGRSLLGLEVAAMVGLCQGKPIAIMYLTLDKIAAKPWLPGIPGTCCAHISI